MFGKRKIAAAGPEPAAPIEGADYYTSYSDMRPEAHAASSTPWQQYNGQQQSQAGMWPGYAQQQPAVMPAVPADGEAAFFNEPEMTELQL